MRAALAGIFAVSLHEFPSKCMPYNNLLVICLQATDYHSGSIQDSQPLPRTVGVIRGGGSFFNTTKTAQSDSASACVLLTFLRYVSLKHSYMRRAEAIVVLLALIWLPLVLLGQSAAPTCNCMCCVRHSSAHSGASSHEAMSCHQRTGTVVCQCGMNSKPGLQPGLLAPLPPTMLSSSLAVPIPTVARRAVATSSQIAVSDFLTLPFKPPRA